MNTALTILLVIAAIIAIPLILALFIKKEYTIERTVTIHKTGEEVFNYIKFLKNQGYYSKWVMADLNARKVYTGTDGTVGFISAWDSDNKKVGKGEQEIKAIIPGKRLDLQLRFVKPFQGVADSYIATQSIALTQTNVTWGFKSAMPYPMNFMRLFMNIEKMLGQDLEESLITLKHVIEKQPVNHSVTV
jgi:hypothetical protein